MTTSQHSQQRPPLDEIFHRLNKHDRAWLEQTLYKRWDCLLHENTSNSVDLVTQQTALWSFDMTMPQLPEKLQVSTFIHEFRARKWSDTELGAMDTWSVEVRRMVNLLLHNEQPAALWFGPNHLLVYNEPYTAIVGSRHPLCLGRPYAEVWPEIDPGILAVLNACQQSGEHFKAEDALHIIEGNGRREELWVTLTLTPLPNAITGDVLGTYASFHFNTDRVLLSRRMSTLLTLGHATARAQDSSDYWKQVLHGLESNPYDILFAAVYSFTKDHHPRTHDQSLNVPLEDWHCTLTGTLGLPEQSTYLPIALDPDTASDLFTTAFRSSMSDGKTLHLSGDTFPRSLQGVVHSSKTGDLCVSSVIFPISPANRKDIHGFVLLGLNPLVSYDSNYEEFVDLLQLQCGNSLASIVLIEEEKRQAHIAADIAMQDRIRLTHKLIESQQETVEEKARFITMANKSPIAMCQIDERGDLIYANGMWRSITQSTADVWLGDAWVQRVHPDDLEMVLTQLQGLLRGEPLPSFEMRWQGDYSAVRDVHCNGEQVTGPIWTIVSAHAEFWPDGTVKGALGCLTDITQQKWMEGFHERRVNEVLELKRSQESFMDMICHEARNPLSAIMLCTETILSTMHDLSMVSNQAGQVMLADSLVQQQLAVAENIMTCSEHQKRIIDDVLTLSKLDAELLVLCPQESRPVEAITQALQMFDAGLAEHRIHKVFTIHQSYHDLEIDWLWLDNKRLLQVLINLITNAIKFTKGQAERQIQVTLSASLTRPTSSVFGVHYDACSQLPQSTTQVSAQEMEDLSRSFSIQLFDNVSPSITQSIPEIDLADLPQTSQCDTIYLAVDINDSGVGISADEMQHLFQKFQQASPKTHVEYGGSGLGLFISRQLIKMLGGAIGAASGAISGKSGSTFAFYIKTSRCAEPGGVSGAIETTGRQSDVASSVNLSKSTPLSLQSSLATDKKSRSSIKHVLVVEDNLVNQKVLRSQLERLGYQVAVANHGEEALDHILNTHYCQPDTGDGLDVVLLDVEMPVCDGLECARRIRQMQKSGQIVGHMPIVAVTANARSEQQAAALEAGMDTVLTKPFRVAQLVEVLARVEKDICG